MKKNTIAIGRFGSVVDFEHPDKPTIVMEDVYDRLSKTYRFNGGTAKQFNILQHQLFVQELAKEYGYSLGVQLLGLTHDLAEAFTGDVCKPFKNVLGSSVEAVEHWLFYKILQALGIRDLGSLLSNQNIEKLKYFDNYATATEWFGLNGGRIINHAGTWDEYLDITQGIRWKDDLNVLKRLSSLSQKQSIEVFKSSLTSMVRFYNVQAEIEKKETA